MFRRVRCKPTYILIHKISQADILSSNRRKKVGFRAYRCAVVTNTKLPEPHIWAFHGSAGFQTERLQLLLGSIVSGGWERVTRKETLHGQGMGSPWASHPHLNHFYVFYTLGFL